LLILVKFDCFGKRRKFAILFFTRKMFFCTNIGVFFSFVQICLKIRKYARFLSKLNIGPYSRTCLITENYPYMPHQQLHCRMSIRKILQNKESLIVSFEMGSSYSYISVLRYSCSLHIVVNCLIASRKNLHFKFKFEFL
jgi:hypothetical protein